MAAVKPQLPTLKDWFTTYLRGFCMGTADLVPGVSGGTVAFVFGFFGTLLDSFRSINGTALRALLRFDLTTFFNTVAWEFLLMLSCGVATAMLILSNPFYFLLHHPIYRTFLYSLFLGLILGATVLCCREIRCWRLSHLVLFLGMTCLMFFVTLPRAASQVPGVRYDVTINSPSIARLADRRALANYDPQTNQLIGVPDFMLSVMLAKGLISGETDVYNQTTQEAGPASHFVKAVSATRIDGWLFLCGMIGVCALLLPGISGSYILTIMGAYPILIAAIADLSRGLTSFSIDVDAFFILTSVFLGVVVGAICFSHVLAYLLRDYHDSTMAALIGCMLGAIPSIWPFWTYESIVPPLRWTHAPQLQTVSPYLPDWTSPYFLIALGWVVIGFFTVLGLEKIKKEAASSTR